MVLYLIGLGLASEKDITVRGLEYIRQSDYVYMEYYTSILGIETAKLETFYGKKITLADREMIEVGFEKEILDKAKTHKVSLLVVGDPLSATTHMDLFLRCKQQSVQIVVVNNASILNSVGVTGLELYKFGETTSLPFFTEKWRPYSFYSKIAKNFRGDLHTLLLLDIKVKEVSEENLAKGKKIYEKPRFMTVRQALEQLLEASRKCGTEDAGLINEDNLCYGVARLGSDTQVIRSGKIRDIMNVDFGGPLHSVVICAKNLSSMEKEVFKIYEKD